MPEPGVTILLPVYNGARFLGEALDSVFAQTYRGFELVLVDDASTDQIDEVLDMHGDPRLRVLRRMERGGTAVALNDGLAEARGRYVALMHADDVSLRDRLARQISFLERHAEVGIVGGNQQPVDVDGRAAGPVTRLPTLPGHIRWMLHVHNCLNHPTIMARRDLLHDLGGYRPEAVPAEDYALWVDAMEATRIANVDDVVLRYRVHPGSASSTRPDEMEARALTAAMGALSRLLGAPPDLPAVRVLRDPPQAETAPIADVREAASLLWRFTAAIVDAGGLDRDERAAVGRSAASWFSHLVRATARRRPAEAVSLLTNGDYRPPMWVLTEGARIRWNRARGRVAR
jgi:hypothetical protein